MNLQIQMMPSILYHKKNHIQKNTSICRWEDNFSAQHVNSIIETKFQKFCFKNKSYKKGTKFCLWTKRLYYFKGIIWLILLNSFYFRVLAQFHEKHLSYFSKWLNEKFNRTNDCHMFVEIELSKVRVIGPVVSFLESDLIYSQTSWELSDLSFRW